MVSTYIMAVLRRQGQESAQHERLLTTERFTASAENIYLNLNLTYNPQLARLSVLLQMVGIMMHYIISEVACTSKYIEAHQRIVITVFNFIFMFGRYKTVHKFATQM